LSRKRTVRVGRAAFVASAGAAVLALVAGCGSKVTPNTSEKTPPTLTWSVLNTSTKQRTDYPATAKVTWTQGDTYFIVFKANDPGGIKSISLSGEADWQCTSSDLGQNKDALYAPQSMTFQPSGNGTVDTYEFLSVNEDPGGWDCGSGFSFANGSASFDGQAANFGGISAQATLSIVRNS
jgi:hypothetical protein